MRLRERTVIERPAAHVWRYVGTAELFRQWNDKVAEMEVHGAFQPGQRFLTRYLWNGRELQCRSTVAAVEEERLLELHHGNCSGRSVRRDIEIVERIELVERGGRTIVIKDVIISNSGIPWFFVLLIWFINRFGRPVRPDRLKTLCEAEAA